jgi:hypothetical protein
MDLTEPEKVECDEQPSGARVESSYPPPDNEPEAAPAHATLMSPAEALERISRGELIEGVRIERLKLRGQFAKAVRMRNVVLAQPLFEKATFADEVALTACTIDRPRFNRGVEFAKGLDLSGSTLVKTFARDLVIRGALRCDNVRARGKFLFADARVEGSARFWDARFEGWVEFQGVTFLDLADFRSLHAEEGFVFKDCRFEKDFWFRGATVSKKWDANGSRFEALLDLSKAKFHDYAYLEAIEQGDRQRFAFQNALAERMLVRPDQLYGRLASEEDRDFAKAMHEYALLRRTFECLHRYEEEDWAFYRFKVNQRRASPKSWRKPWTKLAEFGNWLLLDRGCAYGTSPRRAVVAAAVIIMAFALLYAVGVEFLHVEHSPFASGDKFTFANRTLIGLQTSVAAFTSGFGDLRDSGRGWMNLPLIVESLLGTLLWGLFIVAFGRKVIR